MEAYKFTESAEIIRNANYGQFSHCKEYVLVAMRRRDTVSELLLNLTKLSIFSQSARRDILCIRDTEFVNLTLIKMADFPPKQF